MWVAVTAAIAITPSDGAKTASSKTGTTSSERVCPRTGCAATSCHGELGEPPPSSGGQVAQQPSSPQQPTSPLQATQPNAIRVEVTTCPASGCTSTYCHGAHGQPPSASAAGRSSTPAKARVTVSALQEKLGLTPDGVAGPETLAALKSFQESHGLAPDGVVGPQTLRLLGL
ncbi:MAG: peptidoglycan-binding domain-containing protein [Coriobacteriia bacterium]